jgi:hypothetical protein
MNGLNIRHPINAAEAAEDAAFYTTYLDDDDEDDADIVESFTRAHGLLNNANKGAEKPTIEDDEDKIPCEICNRMFRMEDIVLHQVVFF